jgi:hypothetical protein
MQLKSKGRSMATDLALFVPYSPTGSAWVVRRARTIVSTYRSQREAIEGARGLALDLHERMGGGVRIEVQDAAGGWRVLAPAADGRADDTKASRPAAGRHNPDA